MNIKEDEKRDKYLDFARKPKKLWKMKVTVIPIVINVLGKRARKVGNWRIS